MTAERNVGIDIHKRHVMVAAVDTQQRVVLSPQKVSVERFETWARSHLQPSDSVGLEATTNAWAFHDLLLPIVQSVTVANSHKIRMISASPTKTDKHDAIVLAKLLAAHLLPAVWVPPQAVRNLRRLRNIALNCLKNGVQPRIGSMRCCTSIISRNLKAIPLTGRTSPGGVLCL
jgi:transposase